MELIKVIKNENEELKVSARELHGFLEVKTQFTKWISRMIGYGFEENIDFILVSQKRPTNNSKNPYTTETEYIISLDMAKEISMIQRTAKGKEARRYFIECEKRYRNIVGENYPVIQEGFVNDMIGKIDAANNMLNQILPTLTINLSQQRRINSAVKLRANIITSNVDKDIVSKVKSKVIKLLYKEFYNKFEVSSYRDTQLYRFEEALVFINSWRTNLEEIINNIDVDETQNLVILEELTRR